jgi:hypothetical protein
MKITIDLAETGYPMEKWSGDPDESPSPTGTIQEAIVAEVAQQVRIEIGDVERLAIAEVHKEIRETRLDVIRDRLDEEIATALAEPIRKTNIYGEPTGPETTLKQLVIEEVRDYLEEKVGDRYSSSNRVTRAQQFIQEEVDKVVTRELRAEMAKAKEAAVEVVRGAVTDVVEKEMRDRLKI